MLNRSSSSTVTFENEFTLSGYPDALPPGDYQVLIEEELLQGISFEAYRRTATYLMVGGTAVSSERGELRATTTADLDAALKRDRASTARTVVPTLSTQEGGK